LTASAAHVSGYIQPALSKGTRRVSRCSTRRRCAGTVPNESYRYSKPSLKREPCAINPGPRLIVWDVLRQRGR